MFDEAVLTAQIAQIEAQERSVPSIDMTGGVIHTFPAPFASNLPPETRSTPTALPETVDYIVVEHPSFTPAARAALVPDVPTYDGGVFATNSLWVEYLVFEDGDLSAFDRTTHIPIVTRIDYNRQSHTFPCLPASRGVGRHRLLAPIQSRSQPAGECQCARAWRNPMWS